LKITDQKVEALTSLFIYSQLFLVILCLTTVMVSIYAVYLIQINGMLVVQYDMGDAEQRIVESRRHFSDGRYHYVTFTRNENNVKLQVDSLSERTRSHGKP